MQVIINISEGIMDYIKNNGCLSVVYNDEVAKAIKNGTPLPKRRIIDADELLKRISEKAKIPSLNEATVNGLCGATAIIYDMLNESGQE